ncbi:MAG: hypothetical protein GY940_07255, partial [bacterium]|nr:hypothetical protein [bacterium]
MVRKTLVFTALIAFFTISLAARDSNCMTADCHKEFKDMKRIHAPVEDDCTTCHEKTG